MGFKRTNWGFKLSSLLEDMRRQLADLERSLGALRASWRHQLDNVERIEADITEMEHRWLGIDQTVRDHEERYGAR